MMSKSNWMILRMTRRNFSTSVSFHSRKCATSSSVRLFFSSSAGSYTRWPSSLWRKGVSLRRHIFPPSGSNSIGPQRYANMRIEEQYREGMERPMGLEPTPTAWQAVVLPLYYGRPEQPNSSMCGLLRQVALRNQDSAQISHPNLAFGPPGAILPHRSWREGTA